MSESGKAQVVGWLHALQEQLTAAHLSGATADDGRLAREFNVLLVQAKEHFPQSDTLRLIEPIHADAGMPVLAVRLVLLRRTIDAAVAEGTRVEPRGHERRRWPRHDVAWAARFLLGEGTALAARAVDASRHGLRLVLDGAAAPTLAYGQRCAVEVHLAGSSARFVREAEICHVDDHGVGLAIRDALPAGLVPGPGGVRLAAAPEIHAAARRAGLRARLRELLAW
jgi:hypothetical protein